MAFVRSDANRFADYFGRVDSELKKELKLAAS